MRRSTIVDFAPESPLTDIGASENSHFVFNIGLLLPSKLMLAVFRERALSLATRRGDLKQTGSSRPPGMLGQIADPDRSDACERDGVIVLDRASADPDRANQNAIRVDDGQAARKGNQTLVGMFDAKQRAARLRQIADLPSRHAEEDRCLGFLDGNIDAADPGIVHPVKGLEIGARVDNGNTHFGAKFRRAFTSGVDGDFGVCDGDMHDFASSDLFSLRRIAVTLTINRTSGNQSN